MLPQEFYQASRIFQYDYIYLDALFLIVWIGTLLYKKQYKALLFGALIAPLIYIIDAVIWWNVSAGPTHPAGTFIREYWLNSIKIPHPTGSYTLLKFGADFMMDISYSLFAFSWLWLALNDIRKNKFLSRETWSYTLIWLVSWLLVPALSSLLPIDDTIVQTVRHMNSQFILWIINIFVGYGLLSYIYRDQPKIVLYAFVVGMTGSVIMEFPLYLFGIRQTGLTFLLFETVVLLNQGVPYLLILIDKIIPHYFTSEPARLRRR